MSNNELEGSIIRTPRNDQRPYFSMCRATAQDITISYEALGMLTYLLSKPDNWKIIIKDLHSRVKIGRDKCYTVLNELREARYIVRDDIVDEKQRFKKVVYRIYETPFPEIPDTDSPDTENPDALHNTDSTNNRTKEKDSAQPDGSAEIGLDTSLTHDDITAMLKPVFPGMFLVEDMRGMAECNAGKFLLSVRDFPPIQHYANDTHRFEFHQTPDDPEIVMCNVYRIDEKQVITTPGEADKPDEKTLLSVVECPICHKETSYNSADTWQETSSGFVCPDCIEKRDTLPDKPDAPPKKERKSNPWYDAILATMNVPGYKNRHIQNVLQATGKDGYKKYDLEIPLTDPEQIHVFWAWYEKKCPGCDLISPAAVQTHVMRWQTAGCPDVREKTSTTPDDQPDAMPIEVVDPTQLPPIQYGERS